MNLNELERDELAFDLWRKENFPFFRHKIFLNHAAIVPLPQAVVSALHDYTDVVAAQGQFEFVQREMYDRCRQRVADLLVGPTTKEEVTFASSTSHALGLAATAIDWKAGDNCVVADGDFPANVVTWMNLTPKYGVEVRRIPRKENFAVTLDDVKQLVDENTRIVSLSSVNFLSGCPIDVRAIGQWLREQNVLFCVDAIQTLGVIPLDVEYVDFVCADAHKWLLGPCGVAVFWVRQQTLEKLRPAIMGWLSAPNVENFFAYSIDPLPTAERFSPGERNYLGICGLDAALGLLQDVGAETIANRVVELRDYAAQQLDELGARVLWRGDANLKSGNVSFQLPGQDLKAVYDKLDESFSVSFRHDPDGENWIRLSPHFCNTKRDIDAVMDVLRKFAAANSFAGNLNYGQRD